MRKAVISMSSFNSAHILSYKLGYLQLNIDTKQGKGIRQPDTKRLAALEAKMFLEDEVSKRTLAS